MGLKVQFGKQEYEVQPQRIGRIRRKFGSALQLVQDAAGGDTPDGIGSQLYEGLKVFVPDLAPEWELAGYMTESDFERRGDEDFEEAEYDADRDGSPLTSEIEELLNAIFTVNGGDRLVRLLGKFIDEKTIQRQIRIMQASAVQTRASKALPNFSQPSGTSDPASSSAPNQSSQTKTPTPA